MDNPPWLETFLRLTWHLPLDEAAAHAGTTADQVDAHRRTNPDFDKAVRRALGLPEAEPEPRDILLSQLRQGAMLKDAAGSAGIPLPTIKRWRRCDPGFDAQILEAAAEGGARLGRGNGLRPVSRLQCPGERCGTTTGYESGCRAQDCADAKAEVMAQIRARTRSAHPG